jgi:hypothetical protein
MRAMGMEEQLMVSGHSRDRDRPVSGAVVWLSKALDAVVGAVLDHVPVHVIVALIMCLTATLLFASSKDAWAEVPRLIPDGQFESAGAMGVAVDQSTEESDPSRGDLYVAGFASTVSAGLVNKFSRSGDLLSPPSPIGEGLAPLGYGGAAVDPVNGDVYALDAASPPFAPESEIDIFDPVSGARVGSFPIEPTGGFTYYTPQSVVGIAADSGGNLYVPVVSKNEVLEYDPATCVEEQAKGEPPPCKPLKTFTGGSGAGALKAPTGVAVDPAGNGNLWVADTGNNRIEELNSSDEPVSGGDIPSEGVGSVAFDAHGDVFAIVSNIRDFCGAIKPPCSHLLEYDLAGAQVADLGAGVIGQNQFAKNGTRAAMPDMVAVSEATGEVYVSEAVIDPSPGGPRGRVLKYRPAVAPAVEGETAVEVSSSGAKLGAVVSPGGLGAAYRFEYGTSTGYGGSAPFPEGDTGAGFLARTVWAGVSGLQPGTTYHYRVVVTGVVGGPLVGEDRTFTTARQTSCANEQFRTGFSAGLPDCRAYELVTPPNKAGAQPDKNTGANGGTGIDLSEILADNRAAADTEGNANRFSFFAEDVLPGSPSAGQDYVATRGPAGWSSQNMFPPTDYYGFKCPRGLSAFANKAAVFSEDLSKTLVKVDSAGGECGLDPELVSGEPRGIGIKNWFVRDNATGAYQLIDAPEKGVVGFVPATPSLLGESSDFSRIVFAEEAKLTDDAPAGVNDVYEWTAGHVRLATVLPGGTAVAGSFAGISGDGSRVFFTAVTAGGGGLYARVGGTETVQLDASEAGGPGGGGAFLKASHDGSVVLFSADASARLTSDTVPGSGTNLYRYDFHAPAGERLADLTPVAHAVAPVLSGMSKDGSLVFFTDEDSAALTSTTEAGSGANLYRYEAGAPAGLRLTDLTLAAPAAPVEVQSVLGVSEDGTSVYFTAKGVLTSVPNQHKELPQPGESNVYLSRGAGTAFIAGGAGSVQVSKNGRFLLLASGGELTGYHNFNPVTESSAGELFLYDAAANTLACASCNPSGAPPVTVSINLKTSAGGPDLERTTGARHLSETGQVFFDSAEGLLSADTNGKGGCSEASGYPACTDVYEFEPQGAGSCEDPAGCLSLISTGTGSLETFFIDVSPSGNDVFIREFQKLVPRDTQDEAPSLYDVRVNGGLSEPGPPPLCATPEACRTAPAAQPGVFGAPASQTFSGAGNLTPPPPAVGPKQCKKGYVKKKGKCVRHARKKNSQSKKKKKKK